MVGVNDFTLAEAAEQMPCPQCDGRGYGWFKAFSSGPGAVFGLCELCQPLVALEAAGPTATPTDIRYLARPAQPVRYTQAWDSKAVIDRGTGEPLFGQGMPVVAEMNRRYRQACMLRSSRRRVLALRTALLGHGYVRVSAEFQGDVMSVRFDMATCLVDRGIPLEQTSDTFQAEVSEHLDGLWRDGNLGMFPRLVKVHRDNGLTWR